MLRAMTVEVTVQTVEPTPTAVVAARTTWTEFPQMWGPMLHQVWRFLRGDAPAGLYKHGHSFGGAPVEHGERVPAGRPSLGDLR